MKIKNIDHIFEKIGGLGGFKNILVFIPFFTNLVSLHFKSFILSQMLLMLLSKVFLKINCTKTMLLRNKKFTFGE